MPTTRGKRTYYYESHDSDQDYGDDIQTMAPAPPRTRHPPTIPLQAQPQPQPTAPLVVPQGPLELTLDVKTKFAVARIKRIMQADEDIGKVAQATPTAMAKALELFMITLITKAAAEARQPTNGSGVGGGGKRITAQHLKSALMADPQFDFLSEQCASVPDESAGGGKKGRAKSEAKSEDSMEEDTAPTKKRGRGTRTRNCLADPCKPSQSLCQGDLKKVSSVEPSEPKAKAKRNNNQLNLARLIAGARSPSNKHKLDSPAQRLETTIKVCNNLRFLWQKSNIGPEDEATTARIAELLDRLNRLLVEESRKALPHSCLSHIATSQIYIIVAKLALQLQDNHVIQVSSQLFHSLINGDAEGLLDNKLFSRSLIDLVRYTVLAARAIVDDATKSSLIELLFFVCSKIRLDPSILPAWFYPERERSQARALEGGGRRSQFPLFYVLVQFVHHDGAVGDFARTGLLYLTETAAKSKSLETWMIESDLAPQMASGLGALYSSLSRHFPCLEDAEKSLPILSLSDLPPHSEDDSGGSRAHFQENMKEFLAYLAFWQDALNHCRSAEVSDTLMDHFQVLFVQQLLYPSLLESSDVDGGSTSAVIAHLTRILLALDHQELSRRMLGYLLASKTTGGQDANRKHRPRLSMSRRKSLDHLVALTQAAQSPSPDLFNLLDLLRMSLKSKHVDTVNGSLKLIAVIINKHHQYALTGLFRTEPITGPIPLADLKKFNNTLTEYIEMAASVSTAESAMEQSYQASLVDITARLHSHSCLQSAHDEDDGSLVLAVVPGCKLLESILDLLSTFFGNTTLTNLLLTEAIVSLASCDRIVLHGWLMPIPGTEDLGRQTVTSVLRTLAEQVGEWRSKFPDWESLTAMRCSELSNMENEVEQDAHSLTGQASISQQGISTPAQQSSRPVTPSRRSMGSPAFASIDETLTTLTGQRVNAAPSSLAGSPLRRSYIQPDHTQDAIVPAASSTASISNMEELLNTQVRVRVEKMAEASSDLGSTAWQTESRLVDKQDSGVATPSPEGTGATVSRSQASLNHILTNAIILQEFILEVAAVIQTRGNIFGEVDLQSRDARETVGIKGDGHG
ncbi:hypothetical protein DV738_g3856, partial [Chaetothyriales sp. CBS 135597]